MTTHRRPFAALAAALLLAAAAATPALAQQKPIRVAVIDPARVFNEMQETKELQSQVESELQQRGATAKEKEGELANLQNQRKAMRPDSPQIEEVNRQLMQKAMEYELWSKFTKADAERRHKNRMRSLFSKVEAATAEVAKQQGIDVVIAAQSPKLPDSLDGISIEQLRGALLSRDVLYASDAADVSSAVIALLDARYKSGGAAGPAAAPAPAPAQQ